MNHGVIKIADDAKSGIARREHHRVLRADLIALAIGARFCIKPGEGAARKNLRKLESGVVVAFLVRNQLLLLIAKTDQNGSIGHLITFPSPPSVGEIVPPPV